jgi:bifunctional UDP-N-acetylglucosamine pyrophosphorylase/glucosamine-1-phosphate N-acetyltransferase
VLESDIIRTAAIVRITEENRTLFKEELLFKPIGLWIAEVLKRNGVGELLIVSDTPYRIEAGVEDMFSEIAICDTEHVREALQELAAFGDNCIITIAETVFVDSDTIQELLNTLRIRDKVVLKTGGVPLGVSGFSGEDALDPLLILGALEGQDSYEDYYEIDCLDVGTLGFIINGLEDVCSTEEIVRDTINRAHMSSGVRYVGSETSFISKDVKIGKGSIIYPNTIIKGSTVIGQRCKIGPNTVITDSIIGDGTEVNASQILESKVGENVKIGPFSYIRPGCDVSNNVRIGDFVELKKASVGAGTKISHLTYVGDAVVGENVNFGCGTVTANYDGVAKHTTVIEDGAFIGCNTNLIAPVRVGKNATTAAGTTVTNDVPEGSLAIGRVKQSIKADWNKYRKK